MWLRWGWRDLGCPLIDKQGCPQLLGETQVRRTSSLLLLIAFWLCIDYDTVEEYFERENGNFSREDSRLCKLMTWKKRIEVHENYKVWISPPRAIHPLFFCPPFFCLCRNQEPLPWRFGEWSRISKTRREGYLHSGRCPDARASGDGERLWAFFRRGYFSGTLGTEAWALRVWSTSRSQTDQPGHICKVSILAFDSWWGMRLPALRFLSHLAVRNPGKHFHADLSHQRSEMGRLQVVWLGLTYCVWELEIFGISS